MFAPTEADFEKGVTLFTGETVRTRAGMAHILGEEACRALILLRAPGSDVRGALKRAAAGMTAILHEAAKSVRWESAPGRYCCGICTVALWRHLAAGGLKDARPERWLAAGMRTLKMRRDGKGGWQGFPFWYAILALREIGLPSAAQELRYASPVCERYLGTPANARVIRQRRRLLAEKTLEGC